MSKFTVTAGSLDPLADRLGQLRQLFPEIISENQVDIDRLRALLEEAGALAAGPEHYELRWAGKAAARREMQRQTNATLAPDPASSVDWNATQHVFIEGENLEVLRVLQRGYFGKVKMIYIDPPYNTGNDSFVYPDDYSERRAAYEQRTGLRDEEGLLNKLDLWSKNTRESGQYHSAWLSMLWPRLYLSRNLLREDGVIFVSIDDNEVHNLRLLLNEVFGEENFVVEIVWKKRSTPPNDKIIGANHEYILCFAKNSTAVSLNLKARSQAQTERYTNPDNHPKGPWAAGDLMANVKGGRYVASLHYPITNPHTGEQHWPSSNGNWRFNQARMAELIAAGEITWGSEGTGRPKLKRFLRDVKEGVTRPTIWDFVPLNTSGSQEMAALLGNMNVFDNPKPEGLVRELVALATDPDSLVLDFFGGSGTTGHAVLAQNAQDGGQRRYLLVQLPELTASQTEAYKAGFKTIADITRARLRKVSQHLHAARAGQLPPGATPPDLGFRAYRLAPSNFREWRTDVAAADMLAQLELFQEPLRPTAAAGSDAAVLTELLLKMTGGPDVLPLSVAVARRELGGLAVYDVAQGLLWLALAGLNAATVNAAVAERPRRLVVPGRCFTGDNPDEQVSNARLQLADAGVALHLI